MNDDPCRYCGSDKKAHPRPECRGFKPFFVVEIVHPDLACRFEVLDW